MPSIALFIKELLEEDKYDGTFTSKIDQRIEVLNAAQLQGLYNHLTSTATASKTVMWRQANQEIVSRIRETLDERMKKAAAEQKIIEDYRLQQKQKKMAIVEAEREKQRVQQMIFQKAHDQAEQEVKDREMAREAKEKLEIMQKVFQGEEKRNKYLVRAAIFCVLGCAGVVVGVYFLAQRNIIYIIAGVGLVVLVTVAVVIYASRLTNVKPSKVAPEDLEAQINAREQELQQAAYLVLKEKEQKFEEQERRDKIDRRKRKIQRREQKQYEIELMEQQRQERVRMAREIADRDHQLHLNHSQRPPPPSFSSSSQCLRNEEIESELVSDVIELVPEQCCAVDDNDDESKDIASDNDRDLELFRSEE